MNRADARRIAETVKNHELFQMFEGAKLQIKDWSVSSVLNKHTSKRAAWNLLGKNFDLRKNHHVIAKTNMIREFGEYLPSYLILPESNK